MSADPWTDPDPQPGDFDADLARLDPRYLAHREGGTDAKLVVLVEVKGEDAKRLERLSKARWKKAAEVVAELLRGADSSLAGPLPVVAEHVLAEPSRPALPTRAARRLPPGFRSRFHSDAGDRSAPV